jgi:hypothetical protein
MANFGAHPPLFAAEFTAPFAGAFGAQGELRVNS